MNYNIFRRDRDLQNSDKLSGGGVLIAIRKSIRCSAISVNTKVEQLFVNISFDHKDYVVGCVYIPSNSDITLYQEHAETIESLNEKYKSNYFIICGDFNRPDIRWNRHDYWATHTGYLCQQSQCLIETYECCGLNQINSHENTNSVMLDLCFTNVDTAKMVVAADTLSNSSLHHQAYCISLVTSGIGNSLQSIEKVFNFVEADYDGLNCYYGSLNWDVLLSGDDINSMVDTFYDNLYKGMNLFIPIRTIKLGSSKYPSWFNSDLINLINRKKDAHYKYTNSGNISDYNLFRSIRAECKVLRNELYGKYLSVVEESISKNPKKFWDFAKDGRKDSSIPKTMFFNDDKTSCGQDIVNLMAKNFQSAYVPSDSASVEKVVESSSNLNGFKLDITVENVFELINKLKSNNTCGPDNVPNNFLKSCIYSLSLPIFKLFSKSLVKGIFPSRWKESYVRPIYKSGNRCDVLNYRGVCVQSSLPKMLDGFVCSVLVENCADGISRYQHGFTK